MKRYSTLLVINKHKQKKLDIFNYRMVKIKNITKGLEKVFSLIISGSVNCINFSKGNLTMSMKDIVKCLFKICQPFQTKSTNTHRSIRRQITRKITATL